MCVKVCNVRIYIYIYIYIDTHTLQSYNVISIQPLNKGTPLINIQNKMLDQRRERNVIRCQMFCGKAGVKYYTGGSMLSPLALSRWLSGVTINDNQCRYTERSQLPYTEVI